MWRRGWARSEGQDEFKRLSKGEKKRKRTAGKREWGEENAKMPNARKWELSDVIAQLCPGVFYICVINFLYRTGISSNVLENKEKYLKIK